MFPEGLFYILSRKHGFALDVYDGQTKEDAMLIVWPQKFQDSDNQLWSFDNGRLTNKKSKLVIDISSSAFKKDKTIVQKKRKPNKQSQEWVYDQGFIGSREYPSLVFDIKGDSPKGGAQVLLYKRKDTDNLNQLWQFEPYNHFENALNMAATSVPLHKKEGFGQPRPGYAAEPGVPPELKKVPENNKIAGIGNNVSPSTTTTGPGNSRIDPVLAQYGSFYGGSTTAPPAAQPGQVPSSNQYRPPQAPSSNQYPPPPAPNQAPSPSNFSQAIPTTSAYPPPTDNNSSGYPPYPQQQQPQQHQSFTCYPPPSSPPTGFHQPLSPSSYPQPAPPTPSGGYAPAPTHFPGQSQSGYPPAPSPNMSTGSYNNYGYPSAPGQQQLSTSPPSGYPPSNYPAQPSGNNFYPQQAGYNNNNHGYPPSPSLPGNRPQQQDQYSYPSYPQ